MIVARGKGRDEGTSRPDDSCPRADTFWTRGRTESKGASSAQPAQDHPHRYGRFLRYRSVEQRTNCGIRSRKASLFCTECESRFLSERTLAPRIAWKLDAGGPLRRARPRPGCSGNLFSGRSVTILDRIEGQSTRRPRSVGEAPSGVDTATAVSTDIPERASAGIGFGRIEANTNGETPHDLGKVAGGVIGWNQARTPIPTLERSIRHSRRASAPG